MHKLSARSILLKIPLIYYRCVGITFGGIDYNPESGLQYSRCWDVWGYTYLAIMVTIEIAFCIIAAIYAIAAANSHEFDKHKMVSDYFLLITVLTGLIYHAEVLMNLWYTHRYGLKMISILFRYPIKGIILY